MPYKDPEKRRAAVRAWAEKNRARVIANHKAWRERNPEHLTTYRKQYRGFRGPAHRRDRYGLTPDAFNALVDAQCGRCAICDEEPVGEGPMAVLRVDHDHATGEVRGLLCHNCNAGLGHFKDRQALLSRAAMYLQALAKKHA